MAQTQRAPRVQRASKPVTEPRAPVSSRNTKAERAATAPLVLQFTPKRHPGFKIVSEPPTPEQKRACLKHNQALLADALAKHPDDKATLARLRANIAHLER